MNVKSKLIFIFFLFLCLSTVSVNASNDVDYKLTITDDFQFNEVINYKITNYKSVVNGYNYFVDIIDKDKPSDIFGKSFYQKKVNLNNGVYYVTLTKTYNEYTLSNSALLNNCFQKPVYKYDINNYSFSGSGGFNCLDADNLKITIITNFDSISTNATVDGNKYVWNPTNSNFTMNISFAKKYKDASSDQKIIYDDIQEDNSNDEKSNPAITEDSTNKRVARSKTAKTIFQAIILIGAGSVIILAIVLKKKSAVVDKL